jgi:N-acetyl-D-muramate 6-phosphate phosphatase
LVNTVLFDLDGTLVDTAPDLGYALNQMRLRRDLSPLPAAAIRAQASHGSQGLIRLGFGVAEDDSAFPALRQEFLELYVDHLTDASRLFPGMEALLAGLDERRIGWGVVTNKPTHFTRPLLAGLGLLERMACVVSGDTCAHAKPHPEPMLHACKLAGSAPEDCLYLGDAERDVAAARAVGMPVLVALYGYLSETDRPQSWGATGFIRHPGELLDYPGLRP